MAFVLMTILLFSLVPRIVPLAIIVLRYASELLM